MPEFLYRAHDDSARKVSGQLEAASRIEAAQRLAGRGLSKIYVEPLRTVERPTRATDLIPLPRGATLAPADRMAFYAHLAMMLDSGMPLPRALESLIEQMPGAGPRGVVHNLCARLCRGSALSAAMESMPHAFTLLERTAIRAGEASGTLVTMLTRLSTYEQRNLSLKRHVRSALVYPLFVFAAALLLIAVLAHLMVSGILPVLQQARVQLPPSSTWLVALMKASHHPLGLLSVAVGCVTLGALCWRFLLTHRDEVDAALLTLPLVGDIMRKIETVRLCEGLSTLYGCGIPLTQGLRSVHDMTSNVCVRRLLRQAIEGIIEGRALSEVLGAEVAARPLFPTAVLSMVSVGEHSGSLDIMLDKVASYLDLEVRTAVEGCAAALEPIMIVMLGGVVTFIILTAFAPLYQLLSTLA